jgi:hypothetical protein
MELLVVGRGKEVLVPSGSMVALYPVGHAFQAFAPIATGIQNVFLISRPVGTHVRWSL